MLPNQPRFRDSGPIRVGVGIITIVILLIVTGAIVAFGFGHDFAVGAAGIWAFLWLVLGTFLVFVGIGQTIVRRRNIRRDN
jgi:hypothetical protein